MNKVKSVLTVSMVAMALTALSPAGVFAKGKGAGECTKCKGEKPHTCKENGCTGCAACDAKGAGEKKCDHCNHEGQGNHEGHEHK